jgi:Fe-S cluster biosynthesis and repair protein YggX
MKGRNKMSNYKTKYHRDGTVTIWNVFSQAWQRHQADLIADSVLATLNDSERARIAKIAAKFE